MKKYLLGILGAMALAGCSEDVLMEQPSDKDFIEGMPVFSASVEQEDGSRAVLTNDLKINWQTDDRISIFNKTTDNLQYELEGEGGQTSGTFKVVESAQPASATAWDYYGAVYPYNKNNAAATATNGLKLTYTIPATQTYTPGSFDKAAFPMLAVSATQHLSFKNVCGVLKLQLTGKEIVKSITVSGNSDENLAGTGTTSLTADGAFGEWTATNTSKTVTLSCGAGVQLSTTPTTFHIVLPPTEFQKGFTVRVRAEGKIATRSTTKLQNINRNEILKMPAMACEFKEATQAKLVNGKAFADKIPAEATKLTFVTNSDQMGAPKLLVSDDVTSPSAYIIKDPSATAKTEYLVVTTADEFLFNADCSSMFHYKNNLQGIVLNGCNTSQVTDMKSMFSSCSALTSLHLGDQFNTSQVTDMYYMFKDCSALTSLTLGDQFNTSNVTDMDSMFEGCSALTSLTLGTQFNTSQVIVMPFMFSGCSKLVKLDLSNFDTHSVFVINLMFNNLGNETTTGTELILGKDFDKALSSTLGTLESKEYFLHTFQDAKLKSIRCTQTMKQWILNNAGFNGWYNSTQAEDFKWYDVTKTGNVELAPATAAKLLAGYEEGILQGTEVIFKPNYKETIPEGTREVSVSNDPHKAYYIAAQSLVVTTADEFMLHPNSSKMFYNKPNFNKIELWGCNTKEVTDMTSMFENFGTGTTSGADLWLDVNFEMFTKNQANVTVTKMFKGAKLKAIYCTPAMKKWIEDNAATNGWNERKTSETTLWYNITGYDGCYYPQM